jgi:beta-lactamase class A
MTTLAMDGVLRQRGTVISPQLDLRQFANPTPAAAVAIPSPLEVLAKSQELVGERNRIEARPLIAFGLVAVALATAGATTFASTQHIAQAAAARSVVGSAAGTTKIPGLPAAAPIPIKGQLQSILNNFVAADPNDWGIVVTNLKTGETGSINAGKVMESASLYKLFVAQAIYRAIDAGQLSYGQDAGGGSGMDIADCLNAMITVSDNTCGRALGSIVGWQALNPTLTSTGFTGTDMTNPAQDTDAHDVALLFQRLYAGTLASPASNANFLNLLKSQRVNNRLPVGLPAGTVIAHKTGDLDDYVHDAGIVYGPKSDYLVVVMSGPWDDPGTAPARFGQLSSQLYSYFEN